MKKTNNKTTSHHLKCFQRIITQNFAAELGRIKIIQIVLVDEAMRSHGEHLKAGTLIYQAWSLVKVQP